MARASIPANKLQQGIALVLVLWVLSLLTIMAGSFALSMRREAAIVAGEKDNALALPIAESGIAIAELMLLNANADQRWRTDGSIYEIAYPRPSDANQSDDGSWKIRIRLLSESGKVDINAADEKLLQALLSNAPITQQEQANLVGAIIDWRDSDDLIQLNGAEKDDYAKAGLHYQPGNKPFKAMEELHWVKGMDNTIYQWLQPLITINSGSPQVDFQKATPEVLHAVANMDSGLIDDYVAARVDSARNGLPIPAFPAAGTPAQSPNQKGAAVTIIVEARWDDGTEYSAPDSDDSQQVVAISALVQQAADGANPPFTLIKWQHNTGGSATENTAENSTRDASLFGEAMDDFLVKQYAEYKFDN